ncbi:hypothetical protein LXL04_014906 [Taraxacum kok-saghyz]
MAEQHRSSTKPPHVLVFPFPLQGHIKPIIQFDKRLLSKGVKRLKTTLVTTIYISNKIPSHSQNTSIPIEPISDGFDSGGHQSADNFESYVNKFRQVGSKSLADLIRKLDNEGNPIDAIVYDFFLTWALDVEMEFGINDSCFFTQACTVNNIYYHVHKGLLSIPPAANPGSHPGWALGLFNQFSNIHHSIGYGGRTQARSQILMARRLKGRRWSMILGCRG